MLLLALWVILCTIIGMIGESRGRSGIGFFLFSLLLSPLAGLIVAMTLPPLNLNKELFKDKLDEYKICPKCDELIKAEALTCIYCGNIDFVSEYNNKEMPLTYCIECGALLRKGHFLCDNCNYMNTPVVKQ